MTTHATNTGASNRDSHAHAETCERMQAMRMQHARKTAQNAYAHTVMQKISYKDTRAHADFEWKAPPPVEGEKKGEREEGKRKETKKKAIRCYKL